MNVDLTKMAELVRTEADFLRFMKALLADWQDEQEQLKANPNTQNGTPGPNGWKNETIGAFLDAMIAWTESSDHTHQHNAPADWRSFALMVLAGGRYESCLVCLPSDPTYRRGG